MELYYIVKHPMVRFVRKMSGNVNGGRPGTQHAWLSAGNVPIVFPSDR